MREDHMVTLTAKPSKCYIGFKSLKFLGHTVGDGMMKPHPENVSKVLLTEKCKTKKQVRSCTDTSDFIGVIWVQKFPFLYANRKPVTREAK